MRFVDAELIADFFDAQGAMQIFLHEGERLFDERRQRRLQRLAEQQQHLIRQDARLQIHVRRIGVQQGGHAAHQRLKLAGARQRQHMQMPQMQGAQQIFQNDAGEPDIPFCQAARRASAVGVRETAPDEIDGSGLHRQFCAAFRQHEIAGTKIFNPHDAGLRLARHLPAREPSAMPGKQDNQWLRERAGKRRHVNITRIAGILHEQFMRMIDPQPNPLMFGRILVKKRFISHSRRHCEKETKFPIETSFFDVQKRYHAGRRTHASTKISRFSIFFVA